MKKIFLQTLLLTSLVLIKTSIVQNSKCCSQCNITLFSFNVKTPSKMRDYLATAITNNWNSSYLVSILQQFPTTYFREFVSSISSLDNQVKNGSSSCGGQDFYAYPNEYLPSELISALYDSITDSYSLNFSRVDPNYAQAIIALLNSLKAQFTNGYGLQSDPNNNDIFTYYQDDPSNQTTGSVSSNALASSLASSILNSADPFILTAVNFNYFSRVSKILGYIPYSVTFPNKDYIFLMGYTNSTKLNIQRIYDTRTPPNGLKTFRILIDANNGNPSAPAVISRLKRIDLSTISSSSESVKAKLMSSLLSGYAYCYFPNLVNATHSSCMSSCNSSC